MSNCTVLHNITTTSNILVHNILKMGAGFFDAPTDESELKTLRLRRAAPCPLRPAGAGARAILRPKLSR